MPNSRLRYRVAHTEYCATWDNVMGITHDMIYRISISSNVKMWKHPKLGNYFILIIIIFGKYFYRFCFVPMTRKWQT